MCGEDPPQTVDITLADVQAMFGSRIANPSIVQTGLPSLNQAMRDASINTPYRKAAFLATLVHECQLTRTQFDTLARNGGGLG